MSPSIRKRLSVCSVRTPWIDISAQRHAGMTAFGLYRSLHHSIPDHIMIPEDFLDYGSL